MIEVNLDRLHEEIELDIQNRGLGPTINNLHLYYFLSETPIEVLEQLTIEQLDDIGLLYRPLSIVLGMLDVPHNQIETYRKALIDPEIPDFFKPSELFMIQTDREFFATLDRIVEEMNFQFPERTVPFRSDYFEKLKPLYVRLREEGYSQGDITG